MKLQRSGVWLWLTFVFLSASCRKDPPPPFDYICTLDGFGGGDCVLQDGTRKYRLPSEMLDHWSTNQASFARYASWCYGGTPKQAEVANQVLNQLRGRILWGDHD